MVNRAILGATLAFSGIAISLLLWKATYVPQRGAAVAALVYGGTLLISALFSFLYHTLETARRRRLLRLIDHSAIFLLIAGTYTPFAEIALPRVGETLLAVVWALALLGVGLKLVLHEAYDRAFVPIYLIIGWVFVAALDDILKALDPTAIVLLATGGLAYTAGAIVYFRDIGRWTDPVWHALVLVGVTTHFMAVVAVLPA